VSGGSGEEAFNRALKFLGFRARSEAEVRTKLIQAEFAPKIVDLTLEKLRGLKLLDDEAFARGFARARIEDRGYGPLRLEQELRRKGVGKALIGRILDENFARHGGKERARALVEKRFRGKDLTDAKSLRRAISFLQRRGYRDAIIGEILRQPLRDD
jgi:regulatory protein